MRKKLVRGTARLKQEIVARVAAGASLAALAREPGFPTAAAVWSWGKADPGFRTQLDQALLAGGVGRRLRWDAEKAGALLARFQAGERIASILSDPAMPSKATYQHWCRTQPFFWGEIGRLRALRRAEQIGRHGRARARPFDQAVADRVYLMVLRGTPVKVLKRAWPEAPCPEIIARWRREQPEFDTMMRFAVQMGRRAPARAAPGLTRQRMAAIERHIILGGSLASYAERPGAPSRNTLYEWVQRHAEFAQRVERACAAREDWYFDAITDAQMAAAKTATSMKQVRQASAGLSRQETRLRNRPGRGTWAKWVKGPGR